MKQLDWKSFAIGILLTTTVVFGVAAKDVEEGEKSDSKQIPEYRYVAYTPPYKGPTLGMLNQDINRMVKAGWSVDRVIQSTSSVGPRIGVFYVRKINSN